VAENSIGKYSKDVTFKFFALEEKLGGKKDLLVFIHIQAFFLNLRDPIKQ
jgi:hypothetical protein